VDYLTTFQYPPPPELDADDEDGAADVEDPWGAGTWLNPFIVTVPLADGPVCPLGPLPDEEPFWLAARLLAALPVGAPEVLVPVLEAELEAEPEADEMMDDAAPGEMVCVLTLSLELDLTKELSTSCSESMMAGAGPAKTTPLSRILLMRGWESLVMKT
jgi:hypothetical protein